MSAIISSNELGLLVNAESHPIVNRWLARGDGVACYSNHAFDSGMFGHRIFLSYGSPAAQIETALPPDACPVQGHGMSTAWMYRLESRCPKGSEPISPEVTAERALIDEREKAEDAAAARKAKRRASRAKKVRS